MRLASGGDWLAHAAANMAAVARSLIVAGGIIRSGESLVDPDPVGSSHARRGSWPAASVPGLDRSRIVRRAGRSRPARSVPAVLSARLLDAIGRGADATATVLRRAIAMLAAGRVTAEPRERPAHRATPFPHPGDSAASRNRRGRNQPEGDPDRGPARASSVPEKGLQCRRLRHAR